MRSATALLALVVVLAGCAAGPGSTAGDATESTAATTQPATDGPPPTPVPDLLGEGVACDDDLWVGFWGVDDGFWEHDEVRTGYYLPSNTSLLWVTYVDGTVSGVEHEKTDASGVHADGAAHELNESFTGEHVVRVVAYDDANGNGAFDPGTDRPCRADDEVVQAGPDVIDFDAASRGR